MKKIALAIALAVACVIVRAGAQDFPGYPATGMVLVGQGGSSPPQWVSNLVLTQLPTIGTNTVLGSIAGGTPIALSQQQLTSLVNAFTINLSGSVPSPGSVSGKVLSDNGTWVSSAAGGTLTQINVGAGMDLTAGSCGSGFTTSSGTLSACFDVNAQAGATYTFLSADDKKLVTGTNAGAQSYTLPQAGSGGSFLRGWSVWIENRGAGTLTVTPTVSQIDGVASLALTTNHGVGIFSDGANYFTIRGTLDPAAANTVLSNWTSGIAALIPNVWPSCAADAVHALTYTNGTGVLCTTLGTAAAQAIGTAGANVPLLSTANTWTLAQTFPNNSLTLAEFPTVGANTAIGSVTGAGAPVALSQAQLTSFINAFTTTLTGAVPAPGVVAGKILSDNGTWITAAGSGTVTIITAGTGITLSSGATCTGTCTISVPLVSAYVHDTMGGL